MFQHHWLHRHNFATLQSDSLKNSWGFCYPIRKIINSTILKNFASRNSVFQFMSFRGEALNPTVKYIKLNCFLTTLNFLTNFFISLYQLSMNLTVKPGTFDARSFAVIFRPYRKLESYRWTWIKSGNLVVIIKSCHRVPTRWQLKKWILCNSLFSGQRC